MQMRAAKSFSLKMFQDCDAALTPPTISQAPRGLDAIGYSMFGLMS
jgi:hypothetical protein